jgi:hypothetical protein
MLMQRSFGRRSTLHGGRTMTRNTVPATASMLYELMQSCCCGTLVHGGTIYSHRQICRGRWLGADWSALKSRRHRRGREHHTVPSTASMLYEIMRSCCCGALIHGDNMYFRRQICRGRCLGGCVEHLMSGRPGKDQKHCTGHRFHVIRNHAKISLR